MTNQTLIKAGRTVFGPPPCYQARPFARVLKAAPAAWGYTRFATLALLVPLLLLTGCGPGQRSDSRPTPPVDVPTLQSKADAGDPEAMARLARLYAKGEGVALSYKDAAKWFTAAAEKGNADAQAGLGELHEAGQGVPKDPAKALDYYRKAAANGHAGAQYTLGFLYESGRGVPQDHKEAARWFIKAAEQGEPLSQYDLGQRYIVGLGVPTNNIEALKWLILAAGNGQVDAARKRDELRSSMSRNEIAEAEKLAKQHGAAKPQN